MGAFDDLDKIHGGFEKAFGVPVASSTGNGASGDPRPSHPRRGDELSQPDPSPSAPIKKDVKPVIDTEGKTARMQEEIRKAPGGEPVGKAIARAAFGHDLDREINDPIANDPIAQELILGQATGGPIGKGASWIGGKVITSAPGRIVSRFVDDAARGASKKTREAIGQVKDKASDFLKKNPDVMKAKTPAELREALKKQGAEKGNARGEIFDNVDAKSEVVTRPVLKPLELKPRGENLPKAANEVDEAVSEFDKINTTNAGTEALTKAEGAKKITPRDVANELEALPDKYPKNLGPDKNLAPHEGGPVVREPHGDLQRAGAVEPEREMIKGRAPGVSVESITKKWESLEAKLSSGTNTEKDIAGAMKREREKFLSGKDQEGTISSRSTRKQGSDFQRAYDTSGSAEGSAVNQARKEMSKATLDSLREHIKDPDLIKQVDELTADLSVIKRLGKAAKEKAKIDDTPGKKIPNDTRGMYQRGKDAIAGAASSVASPVDKILAKIANANIQGKVDVHPLVEQALAAGATQASIDSIIADSGKLKEKKK